MCFFKKKDDRTNRQAAPIVEKDATVKSNIKENNVVPLQERRATTIDEQSVIVLLWLLSQKNGVAVESFKVTKKILSRYNLDVARGLQYLIGENLVSDKDGKLFLSERGAQRLNEHNCYVIMHLHPEYKLGIKDFSANPQWHTINDNDIVWGVFNARIMSYTKAKMWSSLHNNYSNMASLLLDESKHLAALDYIFAAAFLETSGMMDDNVLTIYGIEIWNATITAPLMMIKKELNLSNDDLRIKYSESKLVMSLRELLPFYYYDVEEAREFMMEAFEQGDTKGVFAEQMLKQPLKKNTPDVNETQKYFYNSASNILKKQFNS